MNIRAGVILLQHRLLVSYINRGSIQRGLLVEFSCNPHYEIVHWRALLKSAYYECRSSEWLLQHLLLFLKNYKVSSRKIATITLVSGIALANRNGHHTFQQTKTLGSLIFLLFFQENCPGIFTKSVNVTLFLQYGK